MLVDTAGAAITEAIISLGRAMKLQVIAEGVETVGQRDFLASLGCHSFQGYLFSHPLPLEDFDRLLTSKSEFEKLCEKHSHLGSHNADPAQLS
jgi:EAL domain-containing protein (putative c-di-GMP-specific phosphodiesterase class I)